MFITRLRLHNFRNFRDIEVQLQRRVFIVGANATGKSNFLDALRFLRDVAKEDGGGLRSAISARKDFRHIRSLMAHGRDNHVAIEIDVAPVPGADAIWTYSLELELERAGRHRTLIKSERVVREGEALLERPDDKDRSDDRRRTATALEQIDSNIEFRELADFLGSIRYLNLVPQLLRLGQENNMQRLPDDPYGQGFIEHVMATPSNTRKARFRRINESLSTMIPQFSELRAVNDQITGRPHLEAKFDHWRSQGAWQRDHELSDGTLRLIALMWMAQETGGPLLLEEPELSLHDTVIRQLAGAFAMVSRTSGRQIFVTSHSPPLLDDDAVSLGEVVLLRTDKDGTHASLAAEDPQVRVLREAGEPLGQIVVPWTGLASTRLSLVR